MSEGWISGRLEDVCHVYQPETISQKSLEDGPYPVYGANGRIGWHAEFNHENPELLLGCRGSCGFVHFSEPRAWVNGNSMVVRPLSGKIDINFLAYALRGGIDISSAITGAAQPQITRASLMPVVIRYPRDLAEQHRIVALLDEAFAGIATARANVEKKLRNTEELFDGLRLAAFDTTGWDEKPFEDCIEDVTYTNKIQRKNFLDEGDYPVISQEEAFINGYWNSAADVFRVDRPLVLFGDHTKALKYVDFHFVLGADGVKILKPKPFLHPRFFYHQLRTAKLDSLGYARHYKLLKELVIRYPSQSEQQRIATELDSADEQAEHLESIYTRKLAALEELKQSLLQRAFSGNL